MQSKPDAQLLREYAAEKSEQAFAEIVRRHTDLVYSAAFRQTSSPDAAAEIAQKVFIDLARKAHSLAAGLRDDASLAGWLYRATRYVTLNHLRSERRRSRRQRQIMEQLDPSSASPPDWTNVAPLLDELISDLDEPDRDALLLRFFKNQDYRAVGAALGVSDDAAQKRVSRSLEKLRTALHRRGVTATTAALSEAIAVHAVHAAPAGLSASLISASLAGATAESGAALTLLKIMSLTKIQLGLGAIVVAGLATLVSTQYQNLSALRADNQALRGQIASLTANAEQLSNNLARANAPQQLSGDQFRELLRLRGEVGRLRDQMNTLGKAKAKELERPSTPEISSEQMEAAGKFVEHRQNIINAAKQIGVAFRIYANDNNDQYPTNLTECNNELGNITNFYGDIPLDTFEMVNVGKVNDKFPAAISARELTPRPLPSGGWERVYLLGDGSVQLAAAPDKNFDTWEHDNTQPIPSSTQ